MMVVLDFDIPWDQVDGSYWGTLLQCLSLFYSFIGLAIVCDEHMVPSLDTLCHRWGIGEDVAGATFMAFGSAAPEMIINVVATIQATSSDPETTSLGVSAIIGSGMIAFTLIPAACGFFADGDLSLKRRPLFRDQFFYLSSLCILVYIMFDGIVHTWEAGLLVANYTIYLSVIVFATSVRKWYWENVLQIEWVEQQVHAHPDTEYEESNIQAKSAPLLRDDHETSSNPENNRKVYWKRSLSESGFKDFIVKFENQEWDEPALWPEITQEDFEKMDINKRGRVAKFRRFLNDPDFIAQFRGGGAKMIHSKLEESEFEEEEEEEEGFVTRTIEFLATPLVILFENTCPDCALGEKHESLYLVTFFVSLFWVSLLSFLLSSIVERWVELSGVPMIFFGLILVSLGAEIPDTIESVTVARKGLGSMAVSNCQGTQVINICLGLGLPWLMTCLAGSSQIQLNHSLVVPAFFQVIVVFINVSMLLGAAICSGAPKATLNRTKSSMLIATYIGCISSFGLYLHHTGEI